MLDAKLPAVEPPDSGRSRLLSAAAEGNRFADFTERVAELFDIPVAKARKILDRIDDPARWTPGPGPGVTLLGTRPGAAYEGALCGFVRVAPGARFPQHDHLGAEDSIVLQGACTDSDGTVYRRYQDMHYDEGTSHDFEACEGGPDFLTATRALPKS